jgi:amino acid transporter
VAGGSPWCSSSCSGWTVYGTEVCATIAPEYRDPRRDVSKALMASAALTLVVAVLVPIGLGGTEGDAAIAADPNAALVTVFHDVLGSGASVVTVVLAATMLTIVNVSSANSARALYGIADDAMGPTQLAHLNRMDNPAGRSSQGSSSTPSCSCSWAACSGSSSRPTSARSSP